MCIFKALHKDPLEQHKELSLEEFYGFYEVRNFKWKRVCGSSCSVVVVTSYMVTGNG